MNFTLILLLVFIQKNICNINKYFIQYKDKVFFIIIIVIKVRIVKEQGDTL